MTAFRRAALAPALLAALGLAACAPSTATRYDTAEVGRPLYLDFGTVLSAQEVDIEGRNTGLGAATGAAAGGLGGSALGQGTGKALFILGGVLAGGAIGALAEQGLANRTGVQYVVTLETGETVSIVQDVGARDRVLQPGERVVIESSGGFRRIRPASDLPYEVRRPQGVTVVD